MASVNLTTGQIIGAEKGTNKYYHEVGHLEFSKTNSGQRIRVHQEIAMQSIIYGTALCVLYPILLLKIALSICLLYHIIVIMYEEWWCWDYANRLTRGGKHVRGKQE